METTHSLQPQAGCVFSAGDKEISSWGKRNKTTEITEWHIEPATLSECSFSGREEVNLTPSHWECTGSSSLLYVLADEASALLSDSLLLTVSQQQLPPRLHQGTVDVLYTAPRTPWIEKHESFTKGQDMCDNLCPPSDSTSRKSLKVLIPFEPDVMFYWPLWCWTLSEHLRAGDDK